MPVDDQPLDRRELEGLSLFQGVQLGSVHGLLKHCPIQRIGAGELLIEAGKPNHSVYVILSGKLRVHLKLNLDPIALLGPGEVIGELSVIDGQPTTAYVITEEESRLLILSEKNLWSLVDASPVVGRNLLFILAQRLRHGDAQLLTSQEAGEGFAAYAIVDGVTGLSNRRWLEYMLPKQMERCRDSDLDLSLLVIGIDRLKEMAEEHGHIAPERALYTVASVLRHNAPSAQLVARYGEGEFIVTLEDKNAAGAQMVAESLRIKVGETKVTDLAGNSLASITVTIGVAQMAPQDTPELLIGSAERAMQEAGAQGGNQVSTARRSK